MNDVTLWMASVDEAGEVAYREYTGYGEVGVPEVFVDGEGREHHRAIAHTKEEAKRIAVRSWERRVSDDE